MSRRSRPLYLAYGALLVWLTYCAVQAARDGSPWSCAAFVLGSGMAIVGAIREGDRDDALHREAVLAQRRANPRPSERAEDAIDATTAVALAGACCEPWWASAGADHDPTCPNQQRSAA